MPFVVQQEEQKIIIEDENSQVAKELRAPVTKEQIISTAIEIAKQVGFSKFILKTSDGDVWEDPTDVPDNINKSLHIYIVAVNKGA